MTDVFLERRWDSALSEADLQAMADSVETCLGIYRVDWHESFISADARRLLCHFSGPDAESCRVALRNNGADVNNLWPGTEHIAPGVTADDIAMANVIVTRHFDAPIELDDLQALEDANIHCLEAHRVKFVRSFFATDKRRMACLYQAPDAESVRIAQHQATMPVEQVWACNRLTP